MQAFEFPVGLCLLALVTTASWTDLRSRRIPNWLVLAAVALALAVQCYLHGAATGFGQWLMGMLTGGALFLPLYVARAMGAGDVKLMAAIGAFVGPWTGFGIVLLTFSIGGIWALILIVARGKTRSAFANIREMLPFRSRKLQKADPAVEVPRQESVGNLPFAVAIALGTVGAMGLQSANLMF
jgi:prepilin peptidase CpaA